VGVTAACRHEKQKPIQVLAGHVIFGIGSLDIAFDNVGWQPPRHGAARFGR